MGPRISQFKRGEVYQLHVQGWSYNQISHHLKLPKSTVRNIVKNPHTLPKPRGRPPVCLTPIRKRLVFHVTKTAENRRKTLQEIALLEGLTLHRDTISQALAKEGYYRRKPRKKPPTSEKIRENRLEWARNHADWTYNEWKRVIFTDEAAVYPGPHGDIHITRTVDEEFHIDCLSENQRPQFSCMIWGAISAYGTLEIHLFERGSIDSQRYCEEIVPKLVAARCKQFTLDGREPIIQQDNAPIHTSKVSKAHLQELGIHPIKWAAYSPDLSPIENLWAILKRRLRKRGKFSSLAELKTAIEDEWAHISSEEVSHLIQSMPKRCELCITAMGGPTKY